MVTRCRRDANRLALAVAIALGGLAWALPGGTRRQVQSVGVHREISKSLEIGRAATRQLESIPAANRGGDWSYLAALDALNRGDSRRARTLARRASELGSVRAWAILAWLRTLEGTESGTSPIEVDESWGKNRTLRELEAALSWSLVQQGHTFAELSGVSRVQHFGTWPPTLRTVSEDETKEETKEEERARQRRWLNDSRGLLIGRLTGGTRDESSGRDVLISYFDDRRTVPIDVEAARRAAEGFARIAGDESPIFLWIVHSEDPGIADRVASALGELEISLFVAHTAVRDIFTRPRFSLVGSHTWIRPDRRLHAFVPPGVPLACTAKTIVRAR